MFAIYLETISNGKQNNSNTTLINTKSLKQYFFDNSFNIRVSPDQNLAVYQVASGSDINSYVLRNLADNSENKISSIPKNCEFVGWVAKE